MRCRLFLYLLLCLSFKVYSQSCTLAVNINASNTIICSGNPVVLTATASAGIPAYNYVWSTGETTTSISVNKAGTYTVTVNDQTPGCQPVTKSITVVDGTTPGEPVVADESACPGTSVTLTATAPGGTYQWYDAATGGNFLATGPTFTTPPITTKTFFYVETTLNGCTSARTMVTVTLISGPKTTDGSTCAGGSATLMASGATGYQWYDAPTGGTLVGTASSFVTPPLFNTTTYYVVGITNGCASARTAVIAAVLPTPAAPTAPGVTTCYGSVTNLHASSVAGAVFDWFDVPAGGTSLISSPDYTTPVLTTTTTYYVQASVNGCIGPRTAVTVTVNAIPPAPTVADVSTCSGSAATLTATAPGGTYQWFGSATSNTILGTGNTFTTPVLFTSDTYYVQATIGGCTGPRAAVNVTVNPSPTAPTAPGQTICSGSTATLTALGPGGNYEWYDAATGGNLLIAGASYTTPVLTATTTYYVQTTMAGCTSPRTAVTVTVNPVPAAPTAAGVTICTGSVATLSASESGSAFEWYDAATGGNLLASTQTYTTPVLSATTTYYVQTIANGCISPRTAVTVTVNTIPSAPTASGTTVCAGTPATLTASGAGTIQWYDAASGGNLLATGASYTTPALASTTTYYVQASNGSCGSTRTAVIVTVTSTTNQFTYSSGTYCKSSPDPIPLINVPGGTFGASPLGMSINSSTGEINIAASLPGNYTVIYTNACAVTSQAIAIVVTPDASFSYGAANFCQGSANASPVYAIGGTGGNFTATPAGLVFTSPLTGRIDMTASTPGTYTITNTIDVAGGCPVTTSSTTITIYQPVIISAGPNQTVAISSPVQLAGSVNLGLGVTWSGGAGTFSNNTALNPIYTPGVGESGTVTLTLTSGSPPGPCGPKSSTVNITFNAIPVAPTAAGETTCSGSTATLTATAPGGAYSWYDAATGGNLLSTGVTFTTPTLTANTTYYVQTVVNGVSSSRTAVIVTVSSIPAAPTGSGATICSGNPATLTASGSAGTYQWYDAAVGGNLQGTTNPFTTPFLTANKTYYVQTTVNGCISARTQVDVTVNPVPTITSAATNSICSGNGFTYNITADMPGTTFTWSRAVVAGISNPAVSNQSSATISETLINTTGNNINVTYVITPVLNGCPGADFNYVVTVYPTPVVTSPSTEIICSGTSPAYDITFNTTGTIYSWGRAAVPGINNSAVTGQKSSTINETLQNTTTAPIDVTYVITYNTANCAGSTFNVVVTVNPHVIISSPTTGTVCSGSPLNYIITSNIPTAVYNWSRPAVAGISNPAASANTNGPINETLFNTTNSPIHVFYVITTASNGCQILPSFYDVVVNPQPITPVANSNSPVCSGSTINLLTPTIVGGATYLWTGPNGFTSTLKNPSITNVTAANAGTYILYLVANGCSSIGATVDVAVDAKPVADAGPDQTVCSTAPSVQLAGNISGGTVTGIWTTSGTGTFSPSANQLNGLYIPSGLDRDNGSVKLTLASTSKDDCAISFDDMTIKFQPIPATDAGADQSVCAQATTVPLNGKMLVPGDGVWTTSGTGTFTPSAVQVNGAASPAYVPTAADITNGVTLTLTANATNSCYIPSDQMNITFVPPPTVQPGGTVYLLNGDKATLNPVVSDNNVTYLWTPNIFIDNNAIKNPTITGTINRVYTLQVTDARGCIATTTFSVIISPPLTIPNTFTPNNDGINDFWDIQGLIAYKDATVDVFNRNGQKVFHSIGYGTPWDGTYNGKPLPFGTYYYIIDTKTDSRVFSGWVAIVK